MKKQFIWLMILSISCCGNALCSSYKWELGGKTLYQSDTKVDTTIPLRFGVAGNITGFNSCSKFNPKVSVKLMFDQLDNTLVTLSHLPSTLLASLPGYVLCRAKPGLCQLMQDYTARLERQYQLHIKSCQDIVKSATHQNPYSDWITISQVQSWKGSNAKKQSTLAAHNQATHQRDKGILWINNQLAGGKNQKQIQPLRHVAAAGWCIVQNKKSQCRTGNPRSIYAKYWNTPEEFKVWIVSVLGDIGLWVYEGAPPVQSIAGHGLEPVLQKNEKEVAKHLKYVLAKSKNNITADDLEMLSTRDSKMTVKLLEMLENSDERSWLEPNLANRIALGKTIDQSLLAMKILYLGQQEPVVRGINPARQFVDLAMQRMEKEIDLLLYDANARNQLMGDVGRYILSKEFTPLPNNHSTPFQRNTQ